MSRRTLSPSETVVLLRALREARLARLKCDREFHRRLVDTMRANRLQRLFSVE